MDPADSCRQRVRAGTGVSNINGSPFVLSAQGIIGDAGNGNRTVLHEPLPPADSPMHYRSSTSANSRKSATRSQTTLTIINTGVPSGRCQTPHNQPNTNTPTNTATGFRRLVRLVSHGVSR